MRRDKAYLSRDGITTGRGKDTEISLSLTGCVENAAHAAVKKEYEVLLFGYTVEQ